MPNTFKESEMETQLRHLDWSRKQINKCLTSKYHMTFLGRKNWDAESGPLDRPLPLRFHCISVVIISTADMRFM